MNRFHATHLALLATLVLASACGGGDTTNDFSGNLPDNTGDADARDVPYADGRDGATLDNTLFDPGPDGATPDGVDPDGVEPDGVDPDGVDPDAVDPDADASIDVTPTDAAQDTETNDATDVPDLPEDGICANTPPGAASGACIVEAGSAWRLIQGHILVPRDATVDGFLRDGQILIGPDGTIAAVGCNALAGIADAVGATKVLCRDVVVTPGLINGHDHITFTGNTPKNHGTVRYDHRHEWRVGTDTKPDIPVPSTSGQEAWGELRNVLAGTTTMFGSGKADGLLRNLDKDMMAGIDATRKATYDTFPLGDSSGVMLTSGCGYPSLPSAVEVAAGACWVPHVAEGVNAAARNEVLCIASTSKGGVDAMLPHNGFIHGIGVLASDIAAMSGRFESLIWAPRSNIDLYGNTAAVTVYARLGHNIGIGTDWTASGSMNIVRELHCADQFNATNLGAFFNDRDLLDMATINNAKAFKLDDKLGVLAVGRLGDVALWNASVHADERAVLNAAPQDVLLVLRGGTALYGDKEVVKALTADAADCQDELNVCGVTKRVCVTRETGSTLATLTAGAGYGLFFCDDPTGEPSCVPARTGEYDGLPKANDMDGDGILDTDDNCPRVFNPARPLDLDGQADWDLDGLGDACDPCPMDAGTATCRALRADDLDGDLIPDATDKCPTVPDDGLDTDGDGKGNVCDSCPLVSNPGIQSCPGTIYDVKTLRFALGETVRLQNVLVTGVGLAAGVPQGFNVQVVPSDAAWNGSANNSGLYCYHPRGTPMPAAGDRVDVDGTVTDFHGQIELSKLTTVVVNSTGEGGPAPVDVTAAEVATGGARAAALEGVLVRVSNVTVTDVNPALVGGDKTPLNEFVVAGILRINDFIHLASPFPLVDDVFTTLTGVLRWGNDNSKIEPRSEGDLVRAPGVPRLVSFGPAIAFALEGETGDTIPALKVKLLRVVDSPVTILVASAHPDLVDLPNGGDVVIAAGALEATVPVIAKVAGAVTVTLTAQLDATTLTADVRVVGASETPTLQAGTPDEINVAPGADATWTLTTDLPNYGAAAVTITLASDATAQATVPASVDVAPRSMQATVTVHGVADGDTTIRATLGVSMLTLPTHVGVVAAGGVFISEYVEGTSFNKALEIYNGGATPLDLSTCTLKLYANGGTGITTSSPLAASGTLAPGATWVVCSTSAASPLKDKCNGLIAAVNHNGDDAFALECGSVVVDTFGQIGFDPGTGWGAAATDPTFTVDHTLRRKCGITVGNPTATTAFDPAVQWNGFAVNSFDGLGAHTVTCPL
jgi:hypothetical protein